MTLRNHLVRRDAFAPAERGGLAFPCNVCLHNQKTDSEEPCRTCDHNANAQPCPHHFVPYRYVGDGQVCTKCGEHNYDDNV